jgi:hypothetical protein
MATDGLQITSLVHSATRHCLQLVCKLNMNICFFACHSHSHTTSSLFSLSVFFVMSPLSFTNTGYKNKDDDLVMEWENNKDAAAAATAATATNNSDLSAPQVCHGKCPSQPASSLSHRSPASNISHPSRLPVTKIVCLTHDELLLNPEFVKEMNLVDSLQELLNLQEKKVPRVLVCESPKGFPWFLVLTIFFQPQHCTPCACPNTLASQLLRFQLWPSGCW